MDLLLGWLKIENVCDRTVKLEVIVVSLIVLENGIQVEESIFLTIPPHAPRSTNW